MAASKHNFRMAHHSASDIRFPQKRRSKRTSGWRTPRKALRRILFPPSACRDTGQPPGRRCRDRLPRLIPYGASDIRFPQRAWASNARFASRRRFSRLAKGARTGGFRPLARYPPSRRIEDAASPDTLPREKNANPCWFLCKSDLKMDRNAAVIPQFMPIGRAVCVPGGKAFPPQGVSAGTGVALSAAPAQSSVDKVSFHPIEREVFSRFPLGVFIRMP